jgi:intracellular multiplication protein IcmV
MAKKVKEETEIKPKRKPVRNFFKSFVNVKRWIEAEQIATYGKWVGSTAKNVFRRREAARTETFAEATKRLKLSEEDLKARAKQFLFMAGFYFLISLGLFGYAIYLFLVSHFLAGSISFVLGLLVATYALREHFWYMQIKKRRLGCNLRDWMHFVFESIGLNGEKK